ncbi:MAG: MFS transporter, partial [Pseudomonadota bacterium]
MFAQLMTSRRFWPIFVCQFFSALNDNFIKTALSLLVLYQLGTEQGPVLVTLAGATLIVPFFLFSGVGGELADRFDKARVARWIKTAEVPIAILAAVGFYLSSIPMLFASLFGFGVMAALFGPIKYGILPEKLSTAELPAANALVEGATFLAILLGTIAGGIAMTTVSGAVMLAPWMIAALIAGFALLGLASAALVPVTGPAEPTLKVHRNPLSSTALLLGELKADRRLGNAGWITGWFWLAGVVALAMLPTLVRHAINGTEAVTTAGLVVFVVGIAFGSWAAARASHLRPNLAVVPVGAVLMGLFALYAATLIAALPAAPATAVTLGDIAQDPLVIQLGAALFGLAAAGGLFIVPSFAALQMWSAPERRARTIAGVNILHAGLMTVASLALAGGQAAGMAYAVPFLVIAVGSIATAVVVCRAWGRDGIRDLGRAVFNFFYRLEVEGLENLPKPGERAVIAPNHVSLLDGPLLHTVMPDHAAFAIWTGVANWWWSKPFLKLINFFTMDPTNPMATRSLINVVKSGQTLVIFP